MAQKYGDGFGAGSSSDQGAPGTGAGFTKIDYDLYDDSKNIKQRMIRVKRFSSSAGEKWKIYDNEEVVFVLDGNKLLKKEISFLRSASGVNFLISEFKNNDDKKSFNKIRIALKKKMNEDSAK